MLKFILSAMVIALAWVVTLLLELPIWPAIVVTVLAIAIVATIIVVRRIRAGRAARQLEKALTAQAAEQARNVRPDRQAEIEAMQAEFQTAVQALKSSRLGRKGSDALYALPWYAIIGPPGSGKSTALRNSGLQFPYLSSKGGGVRGVGGTRNCDWWLTNEAVLLDTAGRWTTEEEDRDEWLSFLDMLKKHRPRRPLNGILAAVSVGDLGGAHEDEVIALAKRMRERIDEVMARLQMSMPVYLVFTKCDLVPGFVELFNDLDREQRGQIWGFTLPQTGAAVDPRQQFTNGFDEISNNIEARSLKRLSEERRISTRERIYEFPQQLQVLRENLGEFVSHVFSENVYQETPILRGVYFTSGTQEGRPIDRLMSRMAEAFGIRAQLPPTEAIVDPKSYFLRDVFSGVVFRDQNLAVRSASELRRQKMQKYAIAASIFAVAVAVSTVPAYAWYRNHEYLASTLSLIEGLASERADKGPLPVQRLDPLQQRAAELRAWSQEGPPVAMRLGMYQGDDVYPRVRDFYVETMRRDVLRPIMAHDLVEMGQFGRQFEAFDAARPTPEEHGRYYDALKLHLLLTQPRNNDEPPLTAEMQEWPVEAITERWAAQAGQSNPVAMAPHVAFFVNLLAEDPSLAFPRDVETVRRVRAALTRIPASSLALEQMVRDFDGEGYDLTLAQMIGSVGGSLRGTAKVRGAFTRQAWQDRVRALLDAPPARLLGEPWVLGQRMDGTSNQDSRRQQLAELRSNYFRRYIEEWQEFLRTIRVVPPAGEVEALATLQDLTRGAPPPLGRLMQQTAFNVTLPPAPVEEDNKPGESGLISRIRTEFGKTKLGKIASRAEGVIARPEGDTGAPAPQVENLTTADDVAAAFQGFTSFGVAPAPKSPDAPPQPVGLDVYQEQLQFIRDAVQTHLEDPATGPELMAKLQTARTHVRGLIEEQEIGWRPRFEALLWPPVDGASMSSSMAVAAAAGRTWCSEVVAPYERDLAGRYPFDPRGHDMALADFSGFFRPNEGVLWNFYKSGLSHEIMQQGDDFEFARRLGRGTDAVYQRGTVQFLERSYDISSAFFPTGSQEARVDFDVRLRPSPSVATIQLNVDGQNVSYENAPERWTRVRWPGEGAVHGASIEIRGANGMRETIRQEGEWGLFRLIESGTIAAQSRGIFTVVWRLHTQNVDITVDIKPVRSAAPFVGSPRGGARASFLQVLREGYRVPREIVIGGQGCRVQ